MWTSPGSQYSRKAPAMGEWSSAQNDGSGGLPAGPGTNTKRRGLKEVPDVSWVGHLFLTVSSCLGESRSQHVESTDGL